MMRTYTISLISFGVLLLTFIVGSVQIQNRYSLGDQFTYAENKVKTIVNLLTGEKKVEKEETIYMNRIVDLEDPVTNSSAEIEQIYSFAQFTPSDERATRRLLSKRTRENFQRVVESSSIQYLVGQQWNDKALSNLDRYTTVTRIYESDEYDTEVIVFDVEIIGTIELLGYQSPSHFFVTKEIDVETGILLFEQTIRQVTVIDDRKNDVTVKKLIKRETHAHDL